MNAETVKQENQEDLEKKQQRKPLKIKQRILMLRKNQMIKKK